MKDEGIPQPATDEVVIKVLSNEAGGGTRVDIAEHTGAPQALQQALAETPRAKLLALTVDLCRMSPAWDSVRYLCLYAKDGMLQTREAAEDEAALAWPLDVLRFLLEPVLAEVCITYLYELTLEDLSCLTNLRTCWSFSRSFAARRRITGTLRPLAAMTAYCS